MSEKLRESLSAAIDDEADEFELRRVLDEAKDTPELREAWHRYHLVGALIRREVRWRSDGTRLDLRARMWAELEEQELPGDVAAQDVGRGAAKAGLTEVHRAATGEPQLAQADPGLTTARHRKVPWAGRLTGLAVAAGVAFAVVLGLDGFDGTKPTPELAVTSQAPAVLTSVVSDSDRKRANAYMIHHAQQQALNQSGVVNFVKLAAYQGK